MIYETVPNHQKLVFGSRETLLAFLKQNAGIFYTANKLATFCNYRKSNTQVELRQDITGLLEEGHPIISTAKGFAYAVHPNQLLHYIKQLDSRRQGLDRRIQSIRKIYDNWH